MDKQTGKFIARIAENLPDLPSDIMQGWIDNPKGLQKFLLGLSPSETAPEFNNMKFATPILKRDMRKEGWKLLEHAPRRLTSVVGLEPVLFLKQGENYINGEEVVRRARFEINANYGQEDAEWLLEHEKKIPQKLRHYSLVFTGTVWQDLSGCRRIPYLDGNGERWFLDFGRFNVDWHSLVRLVRPRK